MILKLIALAVFCTIGAQARSDESLEKIRTLAEKIARSKSAGADSAYCEYVTISQVDGCSGPSRNALRHKISRNGVIESWEYRSPGQGGDPIGYYRGRIADKEWRGLVRMIAAMRWTEDPVGHRRPPLPPGPTESISVLTLSDGKTKVEYGASGPSPGPIEDAMDQPGMLVQGLMDTIWQLALVEPKAEIRRDSIYVTAEWKWRGPPGARLMFSEDAGGEFCGTARFKWFLDTSSFSVEWHEASTSPGKGRAIRWDLAGTKPSTVRLGFRYDGPAAKVIRVGVLDGIGIRLIPGGSKDTISATVFTDRFEF